MTSWAFRGSPWLADLWWREGSLSIPDSRVASLTSPSLLYPLFLCLSLGTRALSPSFISSLRFFFSPFPPLWPPRQRFLEKSGSFLLLFIVITISWVVVQLMPYSRKRTPPKTTTTYLHRIVSFPFFRRLSNACVACKLRFTARVWTERCGRGWMSPGLHST